MPHFIVVIGAGHIGHAIARRVGVGKHVVLADMRPDNAHAAAEVFSACGMAPRAGLEPATLRLTAGCSAIELPRNVDNLAIVAK